MNGGPEMDERPAQEREYTLAQAARLLETSKQTIRNHMGADPAEVTRRQVNGQPRIYITERALARIGEELRRDQAGNQTEKEPQSTGNCTGKLPDSTEKRAGNRPETAEKDRQAQEIAWLRAQVAAAQAAQDQQKRRSFWDIFRRR